MNKTVNTIIKKSGLSPIGTALWKSPNITKGVSIKSIAILKYLKTFLRPFILNNYITI